MRLASTRTLLLVAVSSPSDSRLRHPPPRQAARETATPTTTPTITTTPLNQTRLSLPLLPMLQRRSCSITEVLLMPPMSSWVSSQAGKPLLQLQLLPPPRLRSKRSSHSLPPGPAASSSGLGHSGRCGEGWGELWRPSGTSMAACKLGQMHERAARISPALAARVYLRPSLPPHRPFCTRSTWGSTTTPASSSP